MGTKRSRSKRLPEQKDPDGPLASAARTVGTVAGVIAKVIGLGEDSTPAPDEQPKKNPPEGSGGFAPSNNHHKGQSEGQGAQCGADTAEAHKQTGVKRK